MMQADDAAKLRLRRIADALGVPVAQLSDSTANLFDGSADFLQLWSQLKTADSRLQALNCIQKVIDAQNSTTGSSP